MPDTNKYQIDVQPMPQYIPDQSDPDNGRYVFTYTVTIKNIGKIGAQLVSRHWIITDGNNEIQEVRGLGVIGKQPLLQPGESFEYTSGSVLTTPIGTMKGSYQMVAEDGTHFSAEIPEFVLASPRALH
ncbi:MAG: Co2+/Mg2+ efflux protein ApaG [Dechloromonas sp.]|uniref:Protein ApaG n=1 Tax=Candidatus Dechloromonas phosphorivorans TaxID=2899244 RepID=A0A935MVW9_9RHOO|nr:Co2+/Mg2+ efflux protein ApaG [Candidatus Dechloromonas phosphorivorans]